jgi:3-hydroxyisobutyrate dehydrogenase-like beta-hydroxyacid dehydrogenase
MGDLAALGFIGLGTMGGPMATHLAAWPGGLLVLDIRPEAMDPVVAAGATAAASVADVGAHSDIVCLMVLHDVQASQVVTELLTTMRPGSIIAIHSTIQVTTAEDLARQAAAHDVVVLDAPVSGSTAGANGGTLAIMVGGDRDAYERCREPFGSMATLVQHMGPIGAGTRAKLARNLITFVTYTAAGEAQRVADAAGIDLRRLGRIVKHSDAVTGAASSVFVREHAVPFADDDWLRGPMEHARTLGEKDLDLVLELADSLGVQIPLAALARERLADELGVPHTD